MRNWFPCRLFEVSRRLATSRQVLKTILLPVASDQLVAEPEVVVVVA